MKKNLVDNIVSSRLLENQSYVKLESFLLVSSCSSCFYIKHYELNTYSLSAR